MYSNVSWPVGSSLNYTTAKGEAAFRNQSALGASAIQIARCVLDHTCVGEATIGFTGKGYAAAFFAAQGLTWLSFG